MMTGRIITASTMPVVSRWHRCPRWWPVWALEQQRVAARSRAADEPLAEAPAPAPAPGSQSPYYDRGHRGEQVDGVG